jgi:hypothetical protein
MRPHERARCRKLNCRPNGARCRSTVGRVDANISASALSRRNLDIELEMRVRMPMRVRMQTLRASMVHSISRLPFSTTGRPGALARRMRADRRSSFVDRIPSTLIASWVEDRSSTLTDSRKHIDASWIETILRRQARHRP